MIGNKNKANFILGAVSLAFFSSYPFKHTFVGGLLAGGFGAAMIGGLADWFAVSALFRRPLGIPFRTAIIPRNREKIFQALVHMVGNQLLMKENIKSKLSEWDIAGTLAKVMVEHGGKNVIKRMLYSFIRDIVAQVKPKQLGKIIDEIIKNTVYKTRVALYIIDGIEWLIKNSYDDKIIKFFLKQCVLLIEHKQAHVLFAQYFIIARQRYEQGMKRRKFFNQLLNLSAEEVGSFGQKALIESLIAMQDEQHTLRQKFKIWLQQWLIIKRTDVVFQQKIQEWIYQFLNKTNAAQYAAKDIAEFCAGALVNNRQTVKWLEVFINQFDKMIADFAQNEHERGKFDQVVKNMISQWLDNYHDEIGKIVMESLDKFTNAMLVAFIENKVGNDLQMIRINGSVVGGLVGVVLYIMSFWL
ncbi:MAG: hypothetical protein H6Q68_1619 [Firmicutes bacterium]|nr:hypothetical protein [Bacillota bacterium]